MAKNIFFIGFLLLLLLFLGCDIYDGENKNWPNEVTIDVYNYTDCPLTLHIDGQNKGEFAPGEAFENSKFGHGVHFLEIFPWNDQRYFCDSRYTPDLKNGGIFLWEITADAPCGHCDPTPTPNPEGTNTPTPTPAATP